jgi:tRNA (Thr-GGU) A37 N-methylase
MPAAAEHTVLVQASYGLVPIGSVQSALRVLGDAPNQRDGAPRAWIRFDEQVAEGAKDLRPGDQIVVLTWLPLQQGRAADELPVAGQSNRWEQHQRAHAVLMGARP